MLGIFKRKISLDDFSDMVLEIHEIISNKFIEEFEEHHPDQNNLVLESHIASMWILTIIMPNDNFRDSLHDRYLSRYSLDADSEDFFKDFQIRYQIYWKAFEISQNRKNFSAVEGALNEVFFFHNLDYNPLKPELGRSNIEESMKLHVIFGNSLNEAAKFISDLRKSVKIIGLD